MSAAQRDVSPGLRGTIPDRWFLTNFRSALTHAVDRGENNLIPALAAYERGMVDYGFRAVRASLRNMERFHAQGSLTHALTKLFFRTIDVVPPLKAAFLSR